MCYTNKQQPQRLIRRALERRDTRRDTLFLQRCSAGIEYLSVFRGSGKSRSGPDYRLGTTEFDVKESLDFTSYFYKLFIHIQ